MTSHLIGFYCLNEINVAATIIVEQVLLINCLHKQARRLRSEHKTELMTRMKDHEEQIQFVDEENKRLNQRIAELIEDRKRNEEEWRKREGETEEEWRKKEKRWHEERKEELERVRKSTTMMTRSDAEGTTQRGRGEGEGKTCEKRMEEEDEEKEKKGKIDAESSKKKSQGEVKRMVEAIKRASSIKESTSFDAGEVSPTSNGTSTESSFDAASAVSFNNHKRSVNLSTTPSSNLDAPSVTPVLNTHPHLSVSTQSSFYVSSSASSPAASLFPASTAETSSASTSLAMSASGVPATISAAVSAAASVASESAGLSKLQERLRKTMERIAMLETNLQVRFAKYMNIISMTDSLNH